MVHYPSIMQPTHVRWEQLDTPPRIPDSQVITENDPENGITNSLDSNHERARPCDEVDSIFPDLKSVFIRNFMTADTYYSSPPIAGLGIPGPDGDVLDLGPRGLIDIPSHILKELPADCLQALNEARAEERKWKSSWSTESDDHARAHLRISYSGIS